MKYLNNSIKSKNKNQVFTSDMSWLKSKTTVQLP